MSLEEVKMTMFGIWSEHVDLSTGDWVRDWVRDEKTRTPHQFVTHADAAEVARDMGEKHPTGRYIAALLD
jgi:hypothetical protein